MTGVTIPCGDLPWLPLAPKIYVKVIRLVPETGEYSVMVRAEPGGVLPRHQHLENSEIYIIKGNGYHPQTGPFHPGDYVSEPKGAIHEEVHFTEETELLMVSNGPSGFLGPNDQILYLMDVPMLQGLSQNAPARA